MQQLIRIEWVDNPQISYFEYLIQNLIKGSKEAIKSIVVKPTFGTFVNYNPRGLLHCGLTDSLGQVFHFNERGLHKELWNEVIIAPVDSSLLDKEWDSLLVEHNESELNK